MTSFSIRQKHLGNQRHFKHHRTPKERSSIFNHTAPLSTLLNNKKSVPLLPTKTGKSFRSRVRLKTSKTMTELPHFETRRVERRHTYKDLGRILNLPKYTETSTNYTMNKYKVSGISSYSGDKREPYNGTAAKIRVRSYIRQTTDPGHSSRSRRIYSKSPKKSREYLLKRLQS